MSTEPNAPPEETPSGEAAPDEAGTPPAAVEQEGEPAPQEPDEPQGGEQEQETPEAPAAEMTAAQKLRAKYPGLDDDQFAEVVAKNYWESTGEISSREKRIRELEAKLEAMEAEEAPEEEPAEPPTNPQIQRLDARIKTLYERGQGMEKETQELLQKIPDLDRQIAKAEARAEDAAEKVGKDDDFDQRAAMTRDKWAALKAGHQTSRETVIRALRELHHRKESLDFEMESLLGDKDWMVRLEQNQREQKKLEQQDDERFNAEFPEYIDKLITETADKLGAPKSEKIRNSLWKHVNRAASMDFFSLAQKGLDRVNVPQLVEGHVKEYLEDRDLVGREKFQEKSKEKLKVSGRPASAPAPPALKPAVAVSQMGSSGRTPAMEAARKYLAARNL